MSSSCLWSQDEDGNWETVCGQVHVLIEGTPGENHYAYCPYCGCLLKEAQYHEVSE